MTYDLATDDNYKSVLLLCLQEKNIQIIIPYLFDWIPRPVLISSSERRGIYSRAATTRVRRSLCMYSIPVTCQNSRRGQSKRTRVADGQSDEAMTSQVEELFCLDSVVRGHHVYKAVWTPSVNSHAGATGHALMDLSPHSLIVL